MVLKENNVGFARLVSALLAGEADARKSLIPENRNCLDSGLLKVIRSGNWRIKAAIAKGNFTV